ncbi:hypothetical protein SAMN05216419_10659 [Nitrosomonas cryotolerans]|uniref:Partition protein C n=1 Tax=Nitrosomonas cryotolerans ATCC 49181 TaxID=1131553 RepID=A0A1N6JXY7_9PROT|nr:ParC family partition-associated protein [Nitrosomonas cryotolerans]SFQ11434.1 hypothetical protein SAMN05216419_10659 [Nitrosomonas cryotolerans]SIO49091.1 hypothetical protein SAMN02743940_0011 [Nitrosomonas cryotolerans ATCC 49181]
MFKSELKTVITPPAFKEILLIGGVKSAAVRMADKGLVLILRIGGEDRILGQYRGGPRYFRSLDGAASVLIQHGIYQFEVNVTGWLPRTLVRKGGDLLDGTNETS